MGGWTIKAILLGLTLISISPLAFGGIFFDDFEDGVPNGWREVAGEWEIIDGTYTVKSPSADPNQVAMTILESPWEITDATITVTFSFDKRDVTGEERPMVFFRLENEENGYAFRFEGGPKSTSIGTLEQGVWSSIRGDATDAITLDEPSTIKIEIQGNIFLVYYNDVLRQRVGDVKAKFEKGRIGLGAGDVSSPIHFEEIRVEGGGVTQFIQDLRPIAAQEKLPLVWGQLKRDGRGQISP